MAAIYKNQTLIFDKSMDISSIKELAANHFDCEPYQVVVCPYQFLNW